MKNTFGNSITITLFGESHGEAIGAIIDGIAPGITVERDDIDNALKLRRPYGKISTARKEADDFKILSGVYNGYTTGTPIAIIIPNSDTKSQDYNNISDTPRPSHADYTAEMKYHGFQDPRGGGHFSGRLTAPIVAAAAILRRALENKGIFIGTHISYLGGIKDKSIASPNDAIKLKSELFPTLDTEAKEKMQAAIEDAANCGDSIGGILETAIFGMPQGVGEPFFDSAESMLSHILFSIPGIKGVEFGLGFGFADMRGSEANDPFIIKDGKIATESNNNGGINGGITNGMPITFRCAVKPTPSIFKKQKTVRLSTMENEMISLSGRHDPAIIHRVRAVVDAAAIIAIADMLASRFGTDYLAK